MAQGRRLLFTLIFQYITLSLANENLVPIFISEIGKPLVSLRSEILTLWIGISPADIADVLLRQKRSRTEKRKSATFESNHSKGFFP